MYLSKLEIFGFKSFAQKTNVVFVEGITSIVGPNGCGKTNIVDAIRWCLGEQKSSALRSDKMENVIFNGTATRKPMGMSEVSLTIQNTKGILPIEYSDITITRRIFRSGESEYLLNKNICRLKDITNLFMDTGIGANAYSVIELKMVETILSNKAEERRTMFEEAAGVNKYKLRRRLALRKLDDVKTDLTRVNDIVSEVEKKVNSLERQAKKADRHNNLSSKLRELELDLAERELALFTLQTEQSKIGKKELLKQKIQIESEVSRIDDELKEHREKLLVIETELQQKRSELSLQTEKIYNTQNSLSLNKERKSSLERNIERFNQELEELKVQLTESENTVTKGDDNIKEIEEKIRIKELERGKVEDKLKEQESALEEKRVQLKVQSDVLLEKFKEITGKENELHNTEDLLKQKTEAINKLNEKILLLTSNVAKTVGYLEELGNEKQEIGKSLKQADSLFLAKQKEKEDCENELSDLKDKELEDKSIIKNLRDKTEFIQSLIDNLEGVSKGAKALLDNQSWAKGESTILAHIGDSEERYRFAIEAALKNNLNNILVETLDDLKNGIEYLQNNEIGKASFYISDLAETTNKDIVDKISGYLQKRKAKKIAQEKGFLGWAKDFVKTENKWISFFNKILGNTAIVNDLDKAFTLFKKYPGFNFTNLNGDYLSADGVVEAGSAPQIDATIFGRKHFLENLRREFPVREKQLAELQNKIKETEEKITSIDLKGLSEKGRLLINDLNNVDKQISRFEFEKQKANDEAEKIQQEIQDLAAEANLFDTKRNQLESLIFTENSIRDEEERKRSLLEENFKLREKEFNLTKDYINELNLELERLIGEKKNTENAIKRAEESISNIRKSIEKREADISDSTNESENILSLIKENQIVLSGLEKAKEEIIGSETEIDARYKALRAEMSERENILKALRIERDRISEEIHLTEMRLNELSIKTQNLYENIEESYSLTLEKKSFDDLDTFNFSERSSEVHDIKQKVKSLGPVNLLAYSEYEEEKERLDFLLKQRTDLIDSEKDVIQTIEEINNTAQKQFMETFEKIRENFIKTFRTLFDPGDEADLRLEENEDPLEAKIEIIAKPKGKRPTSIELLSGGEKTLTAIALLFAIYLVKPSPFCILDEIDAPLDDANIDRFTRILHEFSKNTQFIVVTHNKRTMEAAHILYGVTMQEEGISKLVSVRFDEDIDAIAG
ncbi:MAG: chromosome segregation protein SMC [Ignavibacteriaceae bacterium]|nr:chromosome segregation protein SMC [Ignavibacteriaceae bacterium]